MPNSTKFNTKIPHIRFPVFVKTKLGVVEKANAILDTGAPATEFSDQFLQYAGFIQAGKSGIVLKETLQTQKYEKISIPFLEVCGHQLANIEIYVSHFEKSWGVDALIGLDFFKRFKVTIDYSKGELLTEPF